MTAPAVEASAVVDAHVSTAGEGPISAPMVAALEGAWAAIRARHPEVPAVVLVLGAGSIGTAGGLRLGHFAVMRWADPDQPATETGDGAGASVRLPEVFVGGEVPPGARPMCSGPLLREAAHALANVRGIKDTSRQGRWHNARFKALAEELGIEVEKDPRICWSPTTIPSGTHDLYAEVIDELGRALRLHRAVEATGGGRTKKPNPPACVCEWGAVSGSLRPCWPRGRSRAGCAARTLCPTCPTAQTARMAAPCRPSAVETERGTDTGTRRVNVRRSWVDRLRCRLQKRRVTAMSGRSRIEWTEVTWNPTTGCDRVSAGCDHCYALTLAKRLKGMGSAKYQNDGDPRTSGPGFGVTTHEHTLGAPLRWREPRVVFVNSMSDLFHARVPAEFVARVFAVMAATPQHTYQVLTKRATRLRRLAPDLPWPPNVWMGVSVESRDVADRVDELRQVPAAVRFLSCEPLLGPLDGLDLDRIGWVIAGGESGPGARPMDPAWPAALRDACQAAGVPYFFKQWGGTTPKAGGRLLDERTWDEMPEATVHGARSSSRS